MSKTISDKTKSAVREVLEYVWDDAKKHILEEYETIEDAWKSWQEKEGLMSGVAGDVLDAWEDFNEETVNELLIDLYDGV